MRRHLPIVAALVAVWAGIVGMLLFELGRPHTWPGWLLLCVVGPPAYVALEGAGELVDKARSALPLSNLGWLLLAVILMVLATLGYLFAMRW